MQPRRSVSHQVEKGQSSGSIPALLMLADGAQDTSLDQEMPHYCVAKDFGLNRRGRELKTITIGPHLIRLYTKILAQFQGVVNLNPMQKAFREVDGCAEHIALLHELIWDARERSRSIFVVFLDLAKAFDTVHHDLVTRALRRQGCPEHFIEVVKDLSNGTSDTGEIEIRNGVKQGCPLSPLLFNLVMDELVDELDPHLGCRLSDWLSYSNDGVC